MASILEYDKVYRRAISVLFRIVIIGYSSFLLIYNNSLFPWYVNLGAFVSYFLIYAITLRDIITISMLRLVNDYIIITFVLYQVGTIDLLSMSLVLLPIVNSHNHSGRKKTPLLYVLPILSMWVVTKEFHWSYFVPILCFFFINSFDNLRARYFKFHQELNNIIDDFFIDENISDHPEKIYQIVIPLMNRSKILTSGLSQIICFNPIEDKLIPVNGSYMVWGINIDPDQKKDFFEKLSNKKTKVLLNVGFIVNGKRIDKNLVHICDVNGLLYCYVLIPRDYTIPFKAHISFFFAPIITPFFKRLSKVLNAESNHKKIALSQLVLLKQKIAFVNNSVNTMHFIRNKLGPFKNYIAMAEDFGNTVEIEKKNKIEPHLIKERDKLKSSLTEILNRAEEILQKSNNPFNVYELNGYSREKLFSECLRAWTYYFQTENIVFKWTLADTSQVMVKLNLIGLELVLANWLSNMAENKSDKFGVIFDENDEYLVVTFFNTFTGDGSFVEEFNSSERQEIARRTEGHGLSEIKSFCEQMNLECKLERDQNIVRFSLGFKKSNL